MANKQSRFAVSVPIGQKFLQFYTKRPETLSLKSASKVHLLHPLKKKALVRIDPLNRLFSVLNEKGIGLLEMPASDKGNRQAPC